MAVAHVCLANVYVVLVPKATIPVQHREDKCLAGLSIQQLEDGVMCPAW